MDEKLIKKEVLHQGKGNTDYADGTKISFHIKTETCDEEPKIIDDSRQWKEPAELLLGKKFKLEALEACIRTMASGEVAAFHHRQSAAGSISSGIQDSARCLQ
ncbi:hypothetical protein O3P69_018290 [Scylla paramamosain]|uniref:AIP/AIPL N-terminal FKBP-type PPIase domain-containing protein n=1 Tax=Scylla paramamosain TaxID=85552 RepID=A0AAW0TM21_SCYPA